LKVLAQFLEQNAGLEQAKILLAFSSGLDSRVLANLLHSAKIEFQIAHVNYQLRGDDSELDARFARDCAAQYNVPFHYLEAPISKAPGIQEKARSIRYEWFQSLLSENQLTHIATAHHLDDAIETGLIHWFRGMHLMQFKSLSNRGVVIRPLITFRKKDLLLYARENGLKWREDVSNQSNDYLRNIVRNQVIPAVEANLPDAQKRLKYSIGSLNASALLLEDYRNLLWNDIAKQKENEIWYLDILKLSKLQPNKAYLELLFSPYGIVDTAALVSLYAAENGKYITLGDYNLFKFEGDLIFANLNLITPYKGFEIVKNSNRKETELDPNEILINGSVVKHSLQLRLWNTEDVIYIEKGGSKKVSKFLRDLKINPVDKKRIVVIKDGEETVSVVGHYLHPDYLPLDKDPLNWLIRCY
jgi:tRNA(Ile)-lysidine synthase